MHISRLAHNKIRQDVWIVARNVMPFSIRSPTGKIITFFVSLILTLIERRLTSCAFKYLNILDFINSSKWSHSEDQWQGLKEINTDVSRKIARQKLCGISQKNITNKVFETLIDGPRESLMLFPEIHVKVSRVFEKSKAINRRTLN